MNEYTTCTITVGKGCIAVVVETADPGCYGKESTCYSPVTIENMEEACRLVCQWGKLPYANLAKECQRIHKEEQSRQSMIDYIARNAPDSLIDYLETGEPPEDE